MQLSTLPVYIIITRHLISDKVTKTIVDSLNTGKSRRVSSLVLQINCILYNVAQHVKPAVVTGSSAYIRWFTSVSLTMASITGSQLSK